MTLKRPKSKTATIIASYRTDLNLALNWALMSVDKFGPKRVRPPLPMAKYNTLSGLPS